MRRDDRSTLPVTLANEFDCNPFLRVHAAPIRASVSAHWAVTSLTTST